MQPVKVMLRGINEVHFFLLANADEYRVLTESNQINYALIKLTKTGGMYAKGIEKRQKRPPQDRQKWAEFSAHMVEDSERQKIETGGTTIGK